MILCFLFYPLLFFLIFFLYILSMWWPFLFSILPNVCFDSSNVYTQRIVVVSPLLRVLSPRNFRFFFCFAFSITA